MAPKSKPSGSRTAASGPHAKRPKAAPKKSNPNCYCCYLLTSSQPAFRGSKTYVGYSTDPWRRLRQHNGELAHGGAKRTAGPLHRPWEHVVVVLGFPSQHMALCFEWAWQHPYTSRRTRSAAHRLKKAKMLPAAKLKAMGVVSVKASQAQTCVARKLAQLRVMLAECEPFCNQALTIGFSNHEYASLIGAHEELLNLPRLPNHMNVQVGAGRPLLEGIHTRQRQASEVESRRSNVSCALCDEPVLASVAQGKRVSSAPVHCLSTDCNMQAHAHCLAKLCPEGRLIPDRVACPVCNIELNWPMVVRGYHERMAVVVESNEDDEEDEEKSGSASDENSQGCFSNNIRVMKVGEDDDMSTEKDSEMIIDDIDDDDDNDDDDDDDDDVESIAGSVAESVIVRRSARTNKVLSRLTPGDTNKINVISFLSSSEGEEFEDEEEGTDFIHDVEQHMRGKASLQNAGIGTESDLDKDGSIQGINRGVNDTGGDQVIEVVDNVDGRVNGRGARNDETSADINARRRNARGQSAKSQSAKSQPGNSESGRESASGLKSASWNKQKSESNSSSSDESSSNNSEAERGTRNNKFRRKGRVEKSQPRNIKFGKNQSGKNQLKKTQSGSSSGLQGKHTGKHAWQKKVAQSSSSEDSSSDSSDDDVLGLRENIFGWNLVRVGCQEGDGDGGVVDLS